MPYLPKVPTGKIAVAASWFSSVRDRIEEVKPIAGENVIIESTTEGQKIGVRLEVYALNVCIDGEPGVITVYGPAEGQADV